MSEKKAHSVKVPKTYKAAAKILQEVIAGGKLKSLIYNKRYFNIKALYALVVEALRHTKVLDYVIEKSKILLKEERLDPFLARILISELLWGKKQLPGNSKPVETVVSYKQKLLKAERYHEELMSKDQESRRVTLPRYARVNTICKSVEDVVKYFCAEGWQNATIKFKSYSHYLEKICSLTKKQFTQDVHIKELLVFPPKTDFHEHDLYINGSLFLQDKASCLPAYLLAPEPGSTVLDMCAAPGMKTTHLAALMKNRGKIYAIERDQTRYELLRETIKLSGATCVETLLGDSLSISSCDVPGVQYILVDPSCSGSGIVDRIELEPERSCDPSRLYKLAGFQIKLLHHALTEFPLAKKVIYSTCSLNVQENEEVVEKVMSYFSDSSEFQLAKKILPDSWKNHGSDDYDCGKYCLYSRPEQDVTNGFFIAVFERHSFPPVKGKYSDKYIRNSEKCKETSSKTFESILPLTETSPSAHDRLKDGDENSKLCRSQKRRKKLKTCDVHAITLKETSEEPLDGSTSKASAYGNTFHTKHFEKNNSGNPKCTENLSNQIGLEKIEQNIKATNLKKREKQHDNADSALETISENLFDNGATSVKVIAQKLSCHKSNVSSKDVTTRTSDETKSEEMSDDSDIILADHKQKKQKNDNQANVLERLEKGCPSSTLKEHSSEHLNIKKKKKRSREGSNAHDDLQASADEHTDMLNKRHSFKLKRTFDGGGDGHTDGVNILGNTANTDIITNVVSGSHYSSLNKFSHNLEETGRSKKKNRKRRNFTGSTH